MNKTLLFIAIVLITSFSSCTKDIATNWIGTYTGVSGSFFNHVVISKVNNTTVKVELQQYYLATSSYITYATMNNGKLSSDNALSINEDGTIITDPGVAFHFTGVGSLNGNTLTLSGQAQNKGNASDIRTYTFSGTK